MKQKRPVFSLQMKNARLTSKNYVNGSTRERTDWEVRIGDSWHRVYEDARGTYVMLKKQKTIVVIF